MEPIKIIKAYKNQCEITYNGKPYTVNKWGCVLTNTDGWYQHAVLDFESYSECCDIPNRVVLMTGGKKYRSGGKVAYCFKQ